MAESPKFRIWLNRRLAFGADTPEEKARKDMAPENLKVEVRQNGRWVSV